MALLRSRFSSAQTLSDGAVVRGTVVEAIREVVSAPVEEEVLLGAIGELSLPLPLHETTIAKARPSEISVGVLLLEATGRG